MDPVTMSLIGGGLGAAGNIAGGIIGMGGGTSSGDLINASFNPNFDIATQGSNFDLLSQIGFANAGNLPDPLQQLIGQINGLPMEERMKRRAIAMLPDVMRRMDRGAANPFNIGNLNALEQVLGKLGMTRNDLRGVYDDRAAQRKDIILVGN